MRIQDLQEEDKELLQRRVQALLSIGAPLALLNVPINLAAGLLPSALICGGAALILFGLWWMAWRRRLHALRAATHLALAVGALIILTIALVEKPSANTTICYMAVLPPLAAHMLGRRAALLWCGLAITATCAAYALEGALHLSAVPVAMLAGSAISFAVLQGGLGYLSIVARRVADRHIAEIAEARQVVVRSHDALLDASRAVQDILDNVAAGFFIVDVNLVVQPQCTRSCAALFQTDPVAGRTLLQLLPGLGAREQAMLRLQMEQVFADVIPPEVTLAQLPTRFQVGGRVLHLQGRAVRAQDGAVKGVLFTAADHTDLEESQQQNRHNRLLIELLRRRESFQEFLADAQAELAGARSAIAAGDEVLCRRALHTLKGNAGAYGLDGIMQLIHEIEGMPRLDEAQVGRVRAALETFLEENHEVLGLRLGEQPAEERRVSGEQLRALQTLAQAMPTAEAVVLRGWIEQVMARPARVLLGPVEALVARVAERQGKLVRFEVRGEETRVDARRLAPVFLCLPHLLRNAIDHGLEAPEERLDKPAVGTLRLDIRDEGDACRIEVWDDGRGINEQRLVEKALAGGLLSPQRAERLTQAERLALVFLDGLSTAAEVTDLSGRGVGMAAVRAAVEICGGAVTLQSAVGKGARISVRVPHHARAGRDQT